MKKHPKAGKPMKITKGPLAGKYFVVIDWLTNQFQGKDVEKIAKAHPALVTPALRRNKMKKATNDLVFGSLYPTMDKMVVHDSEIILDENVDNVVSLSEQRRLKIQKGEEDDTTGSSDGDSEDAEPGESDIDGRSVSGEELHSEDGGEGEEAGEQDSDSGDSEGGAGKADDGKPKRKARTTKPAKGKTK